LYIRYEHNEQEILKDGNHTGFGKLCGCQLGFRPDTLCNEGHILSAEHQQSAPLLAGASVSVITQLDKK
jgi:hypothetical protein